MGMISSATLGVAIFVVVSLLLAAWVAAPADRRALRRIVLLAWALLGTTVYAMNAWIPFTNGRDDADDNDYFDQVEYIQYGSFGDALDFGAISEVHEQPGYPWLMALVKLLTGHDLFAYKLFHLFLLIVLALCWYRIGLDLEGRPFARRLLVLVLLLTPMWYYVFFMLKDLVIALLQSVALLMTTRLWRSASLRHTVGAIPAYLAVIPFRSVLVLQSLTVLFGSIAMKVVAKGAPPRRKGQIIAATAVIVVGASVLASRDAMMFLGIRSASRIVGSNEMLELAQGFYASAEVSRSLFPLEYLFTEVTGLNPASWASRDSSWLRGVLALPWIFVVVPFLPVGVFELMRVPPGQALARGVFRRIRQSRAFSTPWSAVLLFIVSSVAVSWQVGDTTRWRIADLPMNAAVALAGWSSVSRHRRVRLLVFWSCAVVCLFSLYYMVRG